MTARAKFVDQKTATAYQTTHILNVNGIDDPSFVVDRLVLRIAASYSAYTSGDFSADNTGFGSGLVTSYWRKTGNVMINNCTFRALDLFQVRQRKPAAIAYDVLATQTPSGAGSYVFDLPIPMRREHGARPADYCVPLAEIGQVQVTLPADPITGTFTSATLTLIAIGHDAKEGEYVAGAHWRFDELTAETGNYVTLDCGGRKLLDLFHYTIDQSSSPISADTNPRVQLDGREVANFRSFNASDTPWLWGQLYSGDDYSTYVTAAGVSNVLVGDLFPALAMQKISAAPQVRIAQIDFGARLATPAHDRFCQTTLYPSQSPADLAQRVPGAGGIDAATMAEIAQKPAANGGKSAGADPFLPAVVRV